ncbi:MAG: efflux RND transporter permease subunit [Gemmatimonadaceae bacterium]
MPASKSVTPPPDHGGGLSALAIRRPVFTAMVMLGLVVLGFFSFRRLPIDQFPDVDLPVVFVQTTYPGASPETVEREVSRRMEEAFNPIEGVRRLSSVSLEGVSQVIVEFELGRPVDEGAQDIRTKIETIRRDLPTDIDPPVVQKLDPAAEPIISLALYSGTATLGSLTTFADEDLRRALEGVSGVGEVRISGGLERQVRVEIDPERLRAAGVSVPQVMRALDAQNLEVPAGRVGRGATEQLVRVTGRIVEARQFGDIVVATRGKGKAPILVRDVATITDGTEEERSLSLLDDPAAATGPQRAVSIDLLKVSGANTVAVADGVIEAIETLRATLPEGTTLRVVRDNSVTIRNSVTSVIDELILGALLTVLIVMLFLNDWKATTITALALPVSVISSFLIMGALGFTLNVLTLLALSLSIGILVDDAIVVVENIVRHREMGAGHVEAARVGTKEIMLAVLATTLSIVAVFVPVAFMKGIIGRFFYQFGITVAWAVMVSLFVSFTLTPMLAAHWGVDPHGAKAGHAKEGWFSSILSRFNRAFDRLAVAYRGIIKWALGHRRTTIAGAVLSIVAAVMLMPFIGGAFMPDVDESQFIVSFETPEGSSLEFTHGRAEEIISELRSLEGVAYTFTTIGAGAIGTVTAGEIYVALTKPHDRELSQSELMVAARAAMRRVYGVETAVLVSSGVGGATAPIQVQVRGADIGELRGLSAQVLKRMRAIDGVVDVKSSLGEPRPELRVEVDRSIASRLGVDMRALAATVRPLFSGQVATRWEDPTGEEREVVVQLPRSLRESPEVVARIPVPIAADGDVTHTVPLGQVARVSRGTAPAQIDRLDLQRVVTISAAVDPSFSLSEASAVIRERLADVTLPAGYGISLGGDTEQLEETAGYMLEAIVLAIILIFLILASQFESITQPFAIMMSLPLSLVGVLLALLVTDTTLNIMSMIGVIMLMGLVTKNAILLIDNANERRREGLARFEALVEAGAVRLRPILMTTVAMIAGMTPVALALGEGGAFRAPMARAVIGGLLTSTVLTLVVVPVVYTYLDDAGAWLRRFAGRAERPVLVGEASLPATPAAAAGTSTAATATASS